MCFGFGVIRKEGQESVCSTCQHVSTGIWIALQPCMGAGRDLCLECANKIATSMGWKHYDANGQTVDPPPPPPRAELADQLIEIFRLGGTPSSTATPVQVTLDGQQWVLDFDHHLTVHILQPGGNGRSTNCGSRSHPEEIIEEMVKELETKRKQILLEFILTPKQPPFEVRAASTLATIKAALDANEKIYNDAMGEIDRIQCQYLDQFGRYQVNQITPDEKARLAVLGERWNRHLYYPEIGQEFLVPSAEVRGPPTLITLAQSHQWRITVMEADYDDPRQIKCLTLSLLI